MEEQQSPTIIEQYVCSIDPGYVNQGFLTAKITFDFQTHVLKLQIISHGTSFVSEVGINHYNRATVVSNWLKKNVFDYFPTKESTPIIFLIEKSFIRYNVPATKQMVDLNLLECTLCSVLKNMGILVEEIPASISKGVLEIATAKGHRANKIQALNFAHSIVTKYFESEKLLTTLFPNGKMDENHIADAFNQLVYWCQRNINSNIFEDPNPVPFLEWSFIYDPKSVYTLK